MQLRDVGWPFGSDGKDDTDFKAEHKVCRI